jgi:hypothetical protein
MQHRSYQWIVSGVRQNHLSSWRSTLYYLFSDVTATEFAEALAFTAQRTHTILMCAMQYLWMGADRVIDSEYFYLPLLEDSLRTHRL